VDVSYGHDVKTLITEVRRLRDGLELIARLKVGESSRCWTIAADTLVGSYREWPPDMFTELPEILR